MKTLTIESLFQEDPLTHKRIKELYTQFSDKRVIEKHYDSKTKILLIESDVGVVRLKQGDTPKLVASIFSGEVIKLSKKVSVQSLGECWGLTARFNGVSLSYYNTFDELISGAFEALLKENPQTTLTLEKIKTTIRTKKPKVVKDDNIKNDKIE